MTSNEIVVKGQAARKAARRLAFTATKVKNAALMGIAEGLLEEQETILAANEQDRTAAREGEMAAAMLDRLLLTPERLAGMASGVRSVASLP